MKAVAISIFLFLFSLQIQALEFHSLSKLKPVEVSFATENKTFIAFHLTLNRPEMLHSDLFLKVEYLIGKDTLNDYLYVNGEDYSGIIKEMFLESGEKVIANLYLNNNGIDLIPEIEGKLEVSKGEEDQPESDAGIFRFTGTIWRSSELPIFRISKNDTDPKSLVLKLALTENFEFDSLFIRAKIISPMQGILVINKDVAVNSEEFLPYSGKTLEIEFPELHIDKPGSYYLQLSQEYSDNRINGIQSVSWELR